MEFYNEDVEFAKEEALCPPGFRFQPTDVELIDFYLSRKIRNQELPSRKIVEVDLYSYNPKDLLEKYKKYGQKENKWYFFTRRNISRPNATRPKRIAGDGKWKSTTGEKRVVRINGNGDEKIQVGWKRTLVFYRGKVKTNYIMHEFRTMDVEVNWVLCSVHERIGGNSTSGSDSDTPRIQGLNLVPYESQSEDDVTRENKGNNGCLAIEPASTSLIPPVSNEKSNEYDLAVFDLLDWPYDYDFDAIMSNEGYDFDAIFHEQFQIGSETKRQCYSTDFGDPQQSQPQALMRSFNNKSTNTDDAVVTID